MHFKLTLASIIICLKINVGIFNVPDFFATDVKVLKKLLFAKFFSARSLLTFLFACHDQWHFIHWKSFSLDVQEENVFESVNRGSTGDRQSLRKSLGLRNVKTTQSKLIVLVVKQAYSPKSKDTS